MDILTILQVITITISLVSLITGYVFSSIEKRRDAMNSLYSNKILDNLHILREQMCEILALANPCAIKEIEINLKKELRYVPNLEVNLMNALNRIKAIYFPFYAQEATLFNSLEELVEGAFDFAVDTTNKEKEKKLIKLYRKAYLNYSLFDCALWEAIIKQSTENKYSEHIFDETYDKVSKEAGVYIVPKKLYKLNRHSHKYHKTHQKITVERIFREYNIKNEHKKD